MSSAPQASSRLPTTLQEWEIVLTHRLLRVDGGNADPLRSFEITPETLAEMCGADEAHATAAEEAFRKALQSDRRLTWALRNGTPKAPGSETPNCMAILALSLLVDSLLDGEGTEDGEYRSKLRQWLKTDLSLMDLRGIATMWQELVAWLDRRVEAGEPFRRLTLPQVPARWTHIGYTRHLSFPTGRDVRFLRRQFGGKGKILIEPAAVIRLLDPIIAGSPVSFGLKAAYYDFRVALRAGRASTEHRFWRLLLRARALSGAVEPSSARLRMEFDEDGMRSYLLGGESGSLGFAPDLGAAVRAPILVESANLGPAIRRGILFFRSSGMASWTAAADTPSTREDIHVAIADRHVRWVQGSSARFLPSGAWHVSAEPLQPGAVADLLLRFDIDGIREIVRTIGLVDGVRTGSSLLGLPRYLPRVEGAAGDVEIRMISPMGTGELIFKNGALYCAGSVEGEFSIDDRQAGWSRRVAFSADAEVHLSLDGTNYGLEPIKEWKTQTSTKPICGSAGEIFWNSGLYIFQDVLEALYASFRTGGGEGEIVALIGRAAGRRNWDILRTLQEATFLDGRMRALWKGRVFTLGKPTLEPVTISRMPAVVVSGAITRRLEADFRATVEAQGGSAFRNIEASSLAPALIGATGVDHVRLAEALGWALRADCQIPVGGDGRYPSVLTGEHYVPASAWDWPSLRFRADAGPTPPVSLVRLVHPGGRDHDLYRVGGSDGIGFLSREAAILEGHARAGTPLFHHRDGYLRRLSNEGALPIEIARTLRLRTLRNGGAVDAGWAYPASQQDAQWVATLFSGLVEGLPARPAPDTNLETRRGRGARRPVWIGGSIAA